MNRIIKAIILHLLVRNQIGYDHVQCRFSIESLSIPQSAFANLLEGFQFFFSLPIGNSFNGINPVVPAPPMSVGLHAPLLAPHSDSINTNNPLQPRPGMQNCQLPSKEFLYVLYPLGENQCGFNRFLGGINIIYITRYWFLTMIPAATKRFFTLFHNLDLVETFRISH